jgi:hypothetical protein
MKYKYVGGKYLHFMTPNRVPVGNPALISLDLRPTALIGIVERRRKILTSTQIRMQQEQSLSDYSQQDLSVMTQKP